MLPNDGADEVVFFGGKAYLGPFCDLSKNYAGRRICYYNSRSAPNARSVTLEKYETTIKTNWHYKCAQALMDRRIGLP